MTLSAREVNQLKHAPTVEGVLPIILERWSPRSFADRDVPQDELALVFEAARWAASSSNEQPWRYLVGTRNSPTHEKIFDCLVPGNQAWAGKAPVLILGVANSKFSKSGSPNLYAVHDLGAANAYLTLQAVARGLIAHQMAGFDRDKARRLLEIPAEYEFGSTIALGYQDEPAALPNDQLISRETSPRERKPLRDFVFASWSEPLQLR